MEKKPVILREDPSSINPRDFSFEAVLDTACERLWDIKIQYTIRRIREMDGELAHLERELEEIVMLRA